jgi:hypothetical protein
MKMNKSRRKFRVASRRATATTSKSCKDIDVNCYALNKRGEFAGASIWSGSIGRGGEVHRSHFAAAPDAGKGRLFESAYLFERKA